MSLWIKTQDDCTICCDNYFKQLDALYRADKSIRELKYNIVTEKSGKIIVLGSYSSISRCLEVCSMIDQHLKSLELFRITGYFIEDEVEAIFVMPAA